MAETIYIKPLTAWEQAQKTRAKLPVPLKILTSLKTTAVLGTILGTLLAPTKALGLVKGAAKFVAPKTIKGAVITAVAVPTAYGFLKASPKAREVVKKYIDPREAVKRGEYIAGIVEDPKKIKEIGKEEGWWKTVKGAAKEGGKYGAVAAGIIGLGVLAKKPVLSLLEKRKAERETGLIPTDLPRAPIELKQPYVPLPTAMPTSISPIQAPQQQIRHPPIQNIIQIQLR